MTANAEPAREPAPGDLARRIGQRRVHLGLSENALAVQSGMAPRYLQQLLAQGPAFDPGGFLRVAAVLGMRYEDLLEGRSDPAPGQSAPAPHPVLTRLTTAECWDRLGEHGVGRVALASRPAPMVFPVNYAVEGRSILYRTASEGPAAAASGAEISFQADRIDDRHSDGWSVLMSGAAERIDDPDTTRRLAEEGVVEPWAGGDRPLWIRIEPTETTGRTIGTM
ncbi:helix-turn-helix domain-containing protein [Streptomyces sp. NBC_01198]|uniref:helix-turn-helix domain-containing protein n=1 Tax=Streptomyces sp. NBC_01198 TaxID=2903769 RepID=UPI002E0DEA87|nr:pyridoxamine 5'-phosphate oxidase family protein [Streptomyces sp. NBC_01198]